VNRELWLEKISPTNIELLQHTRSLSLVAFDPSEMASSSGYIDIDDSYVYFPSFHQLHTIRLFRSHISSDAPERMGMF